MKSKAEFLKNCPKGMELVMYDNLSYDYVNEEQRRIYYKVDLRDTVWFTIYGCVNLSPSAKCFYSFYKSNHHFVTCSTIIKQCIPYEGNEHLLGTIDDCDEFYKTWE